MDTITAAPETRPLEPTTPIKPSEALRLGRLVRPRRAKGALFRGKYAACAVGAMALGYGYDKPGRMNEADTAKVYAFVRRRIRMAGWTGAGGMVKDIFKANDCGYSDDDIATMLRGWGL